MKYPVLWLLLACLTIPVTAATASQSQGRAGTTGFTRQPPVQDHPDSSRVSLGSRDSDLTGRVTLSVAEYFGIPTDIIAPTTRFKEDLRGDPVDVAEIVHLICREHLVAPPDRQGLNTVSELVAHIVETRRNRGAEIMSADEQREFLVQTVFYTTTRAVDDPGKIKTHYGGERATPERGLHYGTCEVTIPVLKHTPGNLESPNFYRLEFKPDPRKHVVLSRIDQLDQDRFWSRLTTGLASGEGESSEDLLLYVHGFNMSFTKAVRRTAQMSYDLGFEGAPLLFSWPSNGSLTGYLSDREDVEWSVGYLMDLLLQLREKSGARRINLLAHSMGSQALLRALHRIALLRGDDEPLFENVILAAPDFDSRTFSEEIVPRAFGLAERWTLYASDKDTALDASRVLSAKRLGTPLALAAGVDIIDATGVDVTPWSVPEFHSYYAKKLRVMADITAVLRGVAPTLRDLLPRQLSGQPYWILTKD